MIKGAMNQKKLLCPRSWPEYNVFSASLAIYVADNRTQINNTTCDYKEENNHQVINELKVFHQHLLNYNKRTFEKFMQDIEKEYRERVNVNKKLQYKIYNLKMQLQVAEKELASIKSDFTF